MSTSDVFAIKKQIKDLSRMQNLKIEDFAPQEGIAYKLADSFGDDLNSTQLRKFFATIKNTYLQARRKSRDSNSTNLSVDIRSQLLLMLPTLAYAKARKLLPDDFYEIVRFCLSQERLQDFNDLERVSQFMEAIVAYHKYIGANKKSKNG